MFKIYVIKSKGQWHWHIKARNGRIVADSGEKYHNKGDCVAMMEKLILGLKLGKYEVLESEVSNG